MMRERRERLKRLNIYNTQLVRLTGLSNYMVEKWIRGEPISKRSEDKINDAILEFSKELLEKRRKLFNN